MKGRPPTPMEERRRTGNRHHKPMGDPVLVGKRLTTDSSLELTTIDANATETVVSPDEPWMPEVPETLTAWDEVKGTDAAAVLWTNTCALLIASNIITEGDLVAVEQFCAAKLQADEALREVARDGMTLDTLNDRGGRASKKTHPAYQVWRQSSVQMRAWAEHLGLSPVARARLGLAIGHGMKLKAEIDAALPKNPVARQREPEVID